MSDSPNILTRRGAIKRMLALLGGTMTATQLALMSETAAAMTGDSKPRFFTGKQFSMLRSVVDLVIPETDTPGALGAGVDHFIDLMLAEWASSDRQARYVEGLESIDMRARESGLDGFSSASAAQQTTLLQTLDKEAFAERDNHTFFAELKRMIVFAYYSSEIGATVELRYQPIPGDYVPCMPIGEDARAWFWMGYSYGL